MKRDFDLIKENRDDEKKRANVRRLQEHESDYAARYAFRKRRERCRNFVNGSGQWGDPIFDHQHGDMVTEEIYLQRRGRLTTRNNQLDTIIRNLTGQLRENMPDGMVISRNREDATVGDVMTEALRKVLDLNHDKELAASHIREVFMSGACGERVEFKWWHKLNRSEVDLTPIDQTRFAYNRDMASPLLKDMNRWVYIHDMSVDDIVATYAKSTKEEEKIREWYAEREYHEDYFTTTGSDMFDNRDFYLPYNTNKRRVIECWRLEYEWRNFVHDQLTGESEITDWTEEEVAELNANRVDQALAIQVEMLRQNGEEPTKKEIAEMRQQLIDTEAVELYDIEERYEPVWTCYHLTPWGHALWVGETPFWHNDSPLELFLHPMVDGEVYGLIHTITDQQKYINRMISMLDFVITSSAKGVLMIDKNMVPKEYSADGADGFEAFAQKFVEFNGVIYYETDPNNPQRMPQHITNNSTPVGMTDMIKLQQELLEKISGVVGPMAGNEPKAGTPSSLYAQMVVNASMTNKDLFDGFFSFLTRRNKKVVQVIQQFWDEDVMLKVTGSRGERGIMVYRPADVRGVDFDLVMTQGANSAVYRSYIEESLRELFVAGAIGIEEYLSESNMPYADALLEKIRNRQASPEEMQQAEQMAQQGQGLAGMMGQAA